MQAVVGQERERSVAESLVRSPAPLVVLGHAAMAVALFWSDGHDQIFALLLVLVSLAAWAAALRAMTLGRSPGFALGERVVFVIALVSAGLSFTREPGIYITGSLVPFYEMSGLVVLLVASYGAEIFAGKRVPPGIVWMRRAMLVLLTLGIGAWMIHASPNPKVDLFPLHQQAARAILSGKSIYEPGVIDTPVTNPAQHATVDEYVYVPLPAVFTTIAYVFTRDCRWAYLVAQLLGGCLLWLVGRRCAPPGARESVWPDLVAASFFFFPRGPFVLEQAWTEPIALPFLAGFAVAVLARRPILASVLLGLVCATKQHLVLYLPFCALLPGIGLRGIGIAGVTALATMAPFAIRTPSGFWRGIYGLHAGGPFRADALSIPAEVAVTGFIMPSWIGFLSSLVPVAFLPRIPRKVAPLLLGSALTFGLFYVLGRQAFCNYYYLLDFTVLLAAAAIGEPDPAVGAPAASDA